MMVPLALPPLPPQAPLKNAYRAKKRLSGHGLRPPRRRQLEARQGVSRRAGWKLVSVRRDFQNRLTEVQLPNNTVNSMGYDPVGIRVRLTQSSGTLRFLYDAEDIVAEYAGTDFTTPHATYTHGPGIDEPLAQRIHDDAAPPGNPDSFEAAYFLRDGLGSVTATIDADATRLTRFTYEAFGQRTETITHPSIAASSRYAFTTRENDNDNGLVYYRSRLLRPDLARFATVDSYRGASPLPISLHRFAYAHNSPTMFTDPSGQDPFTLAVLLATFVFVILNVGVFFPMRQPGESFGSCVHRCIQPVVDFVRWALHNTIVIGIGISVRILLAAWYAIDAGLNIFMREMNFNPPYFDPFVQREAEVAATILLDALFGFLQAAFVRPLAIVGVLFCSYGLTCASRCLGTEGFVGS